MRLRSPSFLPSTAVLELTYSCNHRCLFCSCPWEAERDFRKLPELSTVEWKKHISDLCDSGISNFAFTGGEALLRRDCLEIIEYTSTLSAVRTETVEGKLVQHRVTPDIHLLSNGSTLNRDVMDFLARHSVKLSISLPGLSTFEEHTGRTGVDHVLQCFGMAKEAGVPVTVNSTVTALNAHEVGRTVSAALLAGADQLLLNRFLPGGRGLLHRDRLSLTGEQVRQMLQEVDRVLVRSGRRGNLGTEIPLCLLEGIELKQLQVGTRCSAARGFFVVGPSGFVRVCNHSEKRLAHISMWESLREDPYWRTFTMKRYLPDSCGECSMKLNCDGGCREAANVMYGSPDATDPVLC